MDSPAEVPCGKAGGGVRIARQAPSRTAVPVLAKAATTSRSTQTRRRGAASTTTTPGHGLRFRCVAGVCAPSRCHPLASAPLADQYWVRGTPSRPEHWTTGTEVAPCLHHVSCARVRRLSYRSFLTGSSKRVCPLHSDDASTPPPLPPPGCMALGVYSLTVFPPPVALPGAPLRWRSGL